MTLETTKTATIPNAAAPPTTETTTTATTNKSTTTTNKRGRRKGGYYHQQYIIYDQVYAALKSMSNKIIPLTINRISTSNSVKYFLVKNELIKDVKPEDNLKAEYLIYKYYTIEPKGMLFINRFESFKELFNTS